MQSTLILSYIHLGQNLYCCSLFLHKSLSYCLVSRALAWRISHISCGTGLLVNSFCFWLLRMSISPSFLKDSFTEYRNLLLTIFLSALEYDIQWLLVSMFSDEKSAINLRILCHNQLLLSSTFKFSVFWQFDCDAS